MRMRLAASILAPRAVGTLQAQVPAGWSWIVRRPAILPPGMPIYEYLCENGHRFEVLQRMSDDALTTCEVCGAPVQRVLHPVAVHFKGSGFYTTDYGRGKGAKAEAAKESSSTSSSGSSDNGGSPSKTTETKSAPATKSDS